MITSQSIPFTASQTRSDPDGWFGEVITGSAPNALAVSNTFSLSVATSTRSALDRTVRSHTH